VDSASTLIAAGLKFKNLLEGIAGTPENFWLTVARGDGHFFSPRHKHNFDQFRVIGL
jgi:hypothetical protein